jgi:hypothetical protein
MMMVDILMAAAPSVIGRSMPRGRAARLDGDSHDVVADGPDEVLAHLATSIPRLGLDDKGRDSARPAGSIPTGLRRIWDVGG